MALESVDLLSLLKRARKSTATSTVAELAQAVDQASPRVSAAPTAPTQPTAPPPQPAKAHEEEELADLRAELISDEVLIQRMLGLLYRTKKKNPSGGYISILDMERILGIEREGASFVMSYMKTLKIIEMDDKSRMAITVPGIDYLRSVLGLGAARDRSETAPE